MLGCFRIQLIVGNRPQENTFRRPRPTHEMTTPTALQVEFSSQLFGSEWHLPHCPHVPRLPRPSFAVPPIQWAYLMACIGSTDSALHRPTCGDERMGRPVRDQMTWNLLLAYKLQANT